jgi:hypothetical protein
MLKILVIVLWCNFAGAEEDLVGYVFGKKKATEVAHL